MRKKSIEILLLTSTGLEVSPWHRSLKLHCFRQTKDYIFNYTYFKLPLNEDIKTKTFTLISSQSEFFQDADGSTSVQVFNKLSSCWSAYTHIEEVICTIWVFKISAQINSLLWGLPSSTRAKTSQNHGNIKSLLHYCTITR